MKLSTLTITAAVLSILAGPAAAQSTDPLLGTWKLNATKSKGALFTSGTTVLAAVGDGVKFTVDLKATDGTPYHWEFTAKYDGKDTPVTGGSPFGDSVALTRVNAHTVRIESKKGGKPTISQTMVVSEDGQTRTVTTTGQDAKGQPVSSTTVYEKQ